MNLKSFFPIVESVAGYSKTDWRKDIVAGITVTVMLVPQGMAYAMLAGLPPIYGLYGGLIPLLLYAILGSSRQMSIGPVAISALLILAGVSRLAEPLSEAYINLVLVAGLLIGMVQLSLSVFRLGFLVNFISHPVIVGFTSAAAIIIAISQLKDFLGIPIPRFSHPAETAQYAFQNLEQANWISIAMCIGSMVVMFILKKINKAIPGALIVVVIGTLITWLANGEKLGIDMVKGVPEGLPAFQIPTMNLETIRMLLPTVFTVTIIGIVESIGIAKVIQSRHQNYTIRPNQEFLALGISKIGGAFFQALPTSGSFTRSAVNDESGAKSGFASVTAALLIGLTLLFLTPLFYYLPKAVLAAIILLAVRNLFDWKEAKHLWETHRPDFFMMLATFFVTLILGIEEGVLAGVLLSIAMVLFQTSKPHFAVLGKLPNSPAYRNVLRFDKVNQPDDILVVRFDNQLYFANASYFLDIIKELTIEKGDELKLLILDATSMHDIDSTGLHALEEMLAFLERRNIELYLSGAIGPVRDKLQLAGLAQKIGEKNHFLRIHDAVVYYQNSGKGNGTGWLPEALQSNIDFE